MDLFKVLGIFLAKVLQDGRLVDLPLARPFLKLLVSEQVAEGAEPDLTGVIGLDELEAVHPVKGRFLKQLKAFAQRKRAVEGISTDDDAVKRRRVDELMLTLDGHSCRVEDLALSFTVNPTSSV